MRSRSILCIAFALLLLMGVCTVASAAPAWKNVSTFEELKIALSSGRSVRIAFTDDIEMDEDLYLKDISAVTIDGKGYMLSSEHGIIIENDGRAQLALRDLNIVARFTAPFISADWADMDIELERVRYTGGALLHANQSDVTLNSCTLTHAPARGAVAGDFIAARTVNCLGANILYDEGADEQFSVLSVDGALRLMKGTDTEIRVAAKNGDSAYPDGEGAAVSLNGHSDILLEEIERFSIVYEGDNLCAFVPDEADFENEETEHVCADEDYACWINPIAAFLGENRVAAAGNYAGRYEVEIVYNDGDTDTFSSLSSITAERLRGAVTLHVRYIAPETVDVSGKLVWKDDKDKFGTRPTSVTIALYADGKKTGDTMKVKSGNFTFEDMPYQNADGERIIYTVRQSTNLDPVYETKYAKDSRTITNSLVRAAFEGEHIWKNDGGLEGNRVKKLTISYVRSDGETGAFTIKTDKTKKKFSVESNLNKYDADGGAYSYTYKIAGENRVPGYETVVTVGGKGKLSIESTILSYTVTYYNILYPQGVQTEGEGTPVEIDPGEPVRIDTVRYSESYAYQPPMSLIDELGVPYELFKIETDNPELAIDMGMLEDIESIDLPNVSADSISMNTVVYLKYLEGVAETP